MGQRAVERHHECYHARMKDSSKVKLFAWVKSERRNSRVFPQPLQPAPGQTRRVATRPEGPGVLAAQEPATSLCDQSQLFPVGNQTEGNLYEGRFVVCPSPRDRSVSMPASRHDSRLVLPSSAHQAERSNGHGPKHCRTIQAYQRWSKTSGDVRDLRRLPKAVLIGIRQYLTSH